MLREIRELDPEEAWARPRPGALEWRSRAGIAAACAVTLACAIVAPRVLWSQEVTIDGVDPVWFRNGLAIGVGVLLAAALAPRTRFSALARLAVALPIVHLLAMAAVWIAWRALSPSMPFSVRSTPLLASLPIATVLIATVVAVGGASWLIAPRRSAAWMHAAAMLSLVTLLLLGLWLPIASASWGRGWEAMEAAERALLRPGSMVAFVLAPPFAAAVAFTVLAMHAPERLRRCRIEVASIVAVLFGLAVILRLGSPLSAYFAYSNFVHVLGAVAAVAILSLVGLGVQTALDSRRAGGALRAGHRGAIARDDGPGLVACYELTSWLRGPRTVMRAFTLSTPQGDMPVPAGSRLVAPLPLLTTVLRRGESVAVLQQGDAIVVGGFTEQAIDGAPFRGATLLAPGPDGLVVGRTDEEPFGALHVALHLWRPCVAYVLIATAVAIPALAALL